MGNTVVKNGMVYDKKDNVVLNLTPEAFADALKDGRIVAMNVRGNIYRLYVIDKETYYIRSVYGKGYRDKQDGWIMTGGNYNKALHLVETLCREAGVPLGVYDAYQSRIQRIFNA